MTKITIEIESLRIQGAKIGDHAAFARALQARLRESLSDPTTLQALTAGGSQPARLHLDGGALRADASSAALGRSAADAVVKGIRR